MYAGVDDGEVWTEKTRRGWGRPGFRNLGVTGRRVWPVFSRTLTPSHTHARSGPSLSAFPDLLTLGGREGAGGAVTEWALDQHPRQVQSP